MCISTVLSLPFCTVLQKRFFCMEIFNWDLGKVSVVRRCPLRTVRYIADQGCQISPLLYCLLSLPFCTVLQKRFFRMEIFSWDLGKVFVVRRCPLRTVRYIADQGCQISPLLYCLIIKVAIGPKRSTNRNLKQIITIECTKTVIFQLLRPLDISKLVKRELIQ